MKFTHGGKNEINEIIALARSLPDWFTEEGISQIEKDIPCQHTITASFDGGVVGFLSYFSYEGIAHIGWMGVDKEHQCKGVGSHLLELLIRHASKLSICEIRVKTLGKGDPYEPYKATRNFYYSRGFKDYRTTGSDSLNFSEELELKLDLNSYQHRGRQHV